MKDIAGLLVNCESVLILCAIRKSGLYLYKETGGIMIKKTLGIFIALLMVLTFISCDSAGAGRDADLTVDEIAPGDLAVYEDNLVALSGTGTVELEGIAGSAEALSASFDAMLEDLTGIDTSTLGVSMPELGLSRSYSVPSETEIDGIIDAFATGGSFNVSASITNESTDLSDDGTGLTGIFTVNAAATASGSASYSGDNATYKVNIKSLNNSIIGSNITSLSDPILDMPAFKMNFGTNTSVVVKTDAGYLESVSVDTNSAIILAFSLSDYDDEMGTQIASGKYIYRLTINESVTVTESTESFDVTATLSLEVYDNAGTLRKSYNFTEDDFLSM